MALITATRAKRCNALSRLSTTYVTDLINAASAAIVNYCDTEFEAGTSTTETQYGTGLEYFYVDNVPITTLTSVVITEDDGSTETVTAASMEYDATTGRIAFGPGNSSAYSKWPKTSFANLAVSYAYGNSSIPEDVQEACVQLCVSMHSASGARNPQLKSWKMGEYSETRGAVAGAQAPFTDQIEALLAPYRRLVI